MGHAANRRNVLFCLGALEAVLRAQGARLDAGAAVAAAQAVYQEMVT
jgi:alanine-glyoxylate transaminase/serine-glyoxylate transaminase/serine-pyruvate transaminase